jgi:outer membrane protein assembly factor BamB
LFSIVTPMTLGIDTETTTIEDEYLENLAFYISNDRYDTGKLEYYKEYQERQNTFKDNVKPERVILPLELPSDTSSGGPANTPWPMKCHDNKHTGRSSYSTAHINGLEKWRFRCEGGVDGSPIIDIDGTIYFGDKHREVYAIYPNGTLKWKHQTSGWITSAPALAEDGTLYVGSWDAKLYAFNSTTGAKKWVFKSGASISSSPAIAEDGTIYFGNMISKYTIFAVNPDGTEKWRYPTGYAITSSPAIGDDGTIYIGSGDTYLYALNPDGTLKWRFKTDHYIKGPSSIANDGTVYIGSHDDYLYALYPDNGTMKWKCKVGVGTETNPSIAEDGTIYVGYDKLYAIYPDGTIKWSFELGEDRVIFQSSPAISSDGTIYVGTNIGEVDGGEIIAVNPDGSEKWRKQFSEHGWCDSSPCIAEDGTVYIGSQYTIAWGYIHVFGPVESNSPPETPTITGEINGTVGEDYEYILNVVDPDNNPISFYIEWGDGTNSGWTPERASGEDCYYKHSWLISGSYTIRAKARDTLGEESDWAYLDVTMPRTRTSSYFERFPLLERLFNIHFSRTIFNLQFL